VRPADGQPGCGSGVAAVPARQGSWGAIDGRTPLFFSTDADDSLPADRFAHPYQSDANRSNRLGRSGGMVVAAPLPRRIDMLHSRTRILSGAVLASALLVWGPLGCGNRQNQERQESQDDNARDRNSQDPGSPDRTAQQGGTYNGAGTGQATSTAQGELTNVDASSRTMTVNTPTGTMSFRYNDQTTITGSRTGTAGLATMRGSEVMVQYRTEGAQNVATMIDIRSGSGQTGRDRAPNSSDSPIGQTPSTPNR
jgi:hypothetical protein